ncbi:hypothetical protein A2973_04295 [Candidatus Gottesmanbacteria bacterium RIFCSPLOWO2_01_FULL_49_10]|uniref:Uncharacterized protein n=1 Tax=Candidatus Gottesmanbacteria bacterium RIFCSPLOWO2_01_FULL_49_10 TaxID=1798396 RepID=A0A1F6AYF4_9BACT|nr:MAG: hypothetical protein A2973_04295 [Candidatus Gottesmanbacteria bacterium RIFCSPLOWO2_01_FULL_49_10]
MIPLESRFLPYRAVGTIASALDRQGLYRIRPENVQQVGINIAPTEIVGLSDGKPETQSDGWKLPPGYYRLNFGLRIDRGMIGQGVQPAVNFRSSVFRCGAVGGHVFADGEEEDPPPEAVLYGGPLQANLHVLNPYGLRIEQGAEVAQLSFRTPGASPICSELLSPLRVLTFGSEGILGVGKTTLPDYMPVEGDDRWELTENVPYLATLQGTVTLGPDEVALIQAHQGDYQTQPLLSRLAIYGDALVDPGYSGPVSTLIIPRGDTTLRVDHGLVRLTRFNVINDGRDMPVYDGQYVTSKPAGPDVQFGDVRDSAFMRGF